MGEEGRESLQLRTVAANILNNQSLRAYKLWSFSLRVGQNLVTKFLQNPQNGTRSLKLTTYHLKDLKTEEE
jgi:hypothetical protein